MPAEHGPLTPREWRAQAWRSTGVWAGEGAGQAPEWRADEPRHAHGGPLARVVGAQRGHTRGFKVMSIPPDMQPGGRGPLLSAYQHDRDLLWARLWQLWDLSSQGDAPLFLAVKVLCADRYGARTTLLGLDALIPYGHIHVPDGQTMEQAAKRLVGREVEVVLLNVQPTMSKVTLSETQARWQRVMSAAQPGSLVWGVVTKFVPYGAFLEVEGLGIKALLHVSQISSSTPGHAAEVFSLGERVCAVVLQANSRQLYVSTMALEHEYGEMVDHKAHVMARAAEGPQRIQAA